MMGQVLEELDNIKILKVNTDEFENLASRFGVMSIPTIILFKEGKEIAKNIGFMPKEELQKWLAENK